MILQERIPMHRLILSLSEAMDYGHPAIAEHHRRVAFVSTMIGRELGLAGDDLADLFHAALLHDVGLIRVEDRVRAISRNDLESVAWYGEVGYRLLRDNPLLSRLAPIVRFHSAPYSTGDGGDEDSVPLASFVINVADNVVMGIDPDTNILNQAQRLITKATRGAGEEFHPECVEAFRRAARPESFWLDCVSDRMYGLLLQLVDWPAVAVNEETMQPIAELFGQVTDAASRWTATHSAGVSATAVALAERLRFSPRELLLMRSGGYLHDVGKLTIPSRILDKPGKLTREETEIMRGHSYHTFHILNNVGSMPQVAEWAAFHHERLDGTGYPFRHHAERLTIGARIMAVADTFTAITETRPYRQGSAQTEVLKILAGAVLANALDGDVVAILRAHYVEIDTARRDEQAAYEERVQFLAEQERPAAAA